MAYILNIETATKNCSVSLGKDKQLLDVVEYAGESYSHAEKLHVFIEQILSQNRIKPADLDAVAVSMGPGSYTGLRIGVSAAKGLAYGLDIPLIAVSTLENLAREIKTGSGYIIPVIDARRTEVYSAVYDYRYHLIRDVQADLLENKPFEKFLNEKQVIFVGDAVAKTQKILSHKNAVFSEIKYPSAKQMHLTAYHKFLNKNFENTAYFEPFYLKDFIVVSKKNPLIILFIK